MDSTTVINIAVLVVAVIAAGIAAWQAWDARGARNDAQAARDTAQGYEAAALRASEESASAATRSAAAHEERNSIELSKLPTDKWSLRKVGKSKYELQNVSKEVLFAVYVNELGDGTDLTVFDDDDGRNVGPGESIFFDYSKSFDSPASTTVQVSWGDPLTGDRTDWRRTLS